MSGKEGIKINIRLEIANIETKIDLCFEKSKDFAYSKNASDACSNEEIIMSLTFYDNESFKNTINFKYCHKCDNKFNFIECDEKLNNHDKNHALIINNDEISLNIKVIEGDNLNSFKVPTKFYDFAKKSHKDNYLNLVDNCNKQLLNFAISSIFGKENILNNINISKNLEEQIMTISLFKELGNIDINYGIKAKNINKLNEIIFSEATNTKKIEGSKNTFCLKEPKEFKGTILEIKSSYMNRFRELMQSILKGNNDAMFKPIQYSSETYRFDFSDGVIMNISEKEILCGTNKLYLKYVKEFFETIEQIKYFNALQL